MINRRILFVSFIAYTQFGASAVVSKTHLAIRPMRPSFFTTNPLFFSRTNDGERQKYNLTLDVYGGRTFDGQRIASYFLPNGQNCLTAGEFSSQIMQGELTDVIDYNRIIATYFGVQTANPLVVNYGTDEAPNFDFNHASTFQSDLRICPRQSMVGIDFGGLIWLRDHWFIRAALPVQRIHNSMNLCEHITNAGGGNPPPGANIYTTMKDALAHSQYGKICNPKPVWHLASVDLAIGRELISCERALLGAYLGGSIATGNRVCSKFLFEPIVGFDHHSGPNAGFYTKFDWRKNDRVTISLVSDCALEYWASNNQIRLVDMKNRPWSRYLMTYPNRQAVPVTGIDTAASNNPFAVCVNVKQGFAGYFNGAIVCNRHDKYLFEGGYKVTVTDAEQVSLVNTFNSHGTIAIAGIPLGGIDPYHTAPESNSLATISTYMLRGATNTTDDTYVTIGGKDLDLESAATPMRLEHTLFGGLAFNTKHLSVHAGAAVILASGNVVPRRWLVSATVAASF